MSEDEIYTNNLEALQDVLEEAQLWDDIFQGATITRIKIYPHGKSSLNNTEEVWVQRRKSGRYTLQSRIGMTHHNDSEPRQVAGELKDRNISLTTEGTKHSFYTDLKKQAASYYFNEEVKRRQEARTTQT